MPANPPPTNPLIPPPHTHTQALISTGFKVPEKNILLSVQDSLRDEVIHAAYQLHQSGYNLYATKATYDFLQKCHVPCHLLNFPNQPGKTRFFVAFVCGGWVGGGLAD